MIIYKCENPDLYDTVKYLNHSGKSEGDCLENYYDQIGAVIYEHLLYKKTVTVMPDKIYIGTIREIKKKSKPKKRTGFFEFSAYMKECRRLTKLQNLDSLENSDKQRVLGYLDNSAKLLNSNEHYVIDHKISIWYGFKNKIPLEHIADISNLQWITFYENGIKGVNIFVDDLNRWILD